MSDTPQSVSGEISLSGGIAAVVHHIPVHDAKYVSGILYTTGGVTYIVRRYRAAGGALSFTGSLVKNVGKNLSGSLNQSGSLDSGHTYKEHLYGDLTLDGTLGANVGKSVDGTVTLSGGVKKGVGAAVGGSLAMTGGVLTSILDGLLELTGTLVANVKKAVGGALSLTGAVVGGKTYLREGWLNLGREANLDLSGDLTYSLALNRAVGGTLSLTGDLYDSRPSGDLAFTGGVTYIIKYSSVPVSGTLSLTGTLGYTINHRVSVDGGLTFMKVLSGTPHYASAVSLLNTAATKDLVIEQGVSFQRVFRWMKSDGLPFDLTSFTLKMSIKNTYDTVDYIAYSPASITITKSLIDVGVFTVDIADSVTSEMDFTRAVYEITASWGSYIVRLIAGAVTLNRTVSVKHAVRVNTGTLTFTGGVTYVKHAV